MSKQSKFRKDQKYVNEGEGIIDDVDIDEQAVPIPKPDPP